MPDNNARDNVRMEDLIAAHWKPEQQMLWFEGEWWSAERFFNLVDKNVARLRQAGFGAGDRIATLLPNSPAFLAICVAAWKLRGTVAPLNAQAGPQALSSLIKHAMPAVIAATAAMKGQAEALQGLPMQRVFVEDKGSLPEFKATPMPKSGEDAAMLFYTSGSTGTPKGVLITHRNIISCTRQALTHRLPDIAKQTMFNVLPNFHTLGGVISGTLPLIVGIKQAILAGFMPVDGTMRAIEESRASLIIAVPTLLHFLCGAAAKRDWKPGCINYLISGGDRMGARLRQRLSHCFEGCTIIEGYGLTECSPLLAVQCGTPDDIDGSAGLLLDDIEYQLRDTEGNLVSGDEGVLWVRGPNVTSGYFNAPELNAKKFKDGWFCTDDMVRVDEKRNVFIKERVSDLIIVGGFNVYPQEVEAVLDANPKVSESAVVGISRSVTGQMIRAFVIPAKGQTVTSGELVDWCRERLPHYKAPRRVEIVSDLPRNAMGKILRRKLREQADAAE